MQLLLTYEKKMIIIHQIAVSISNFTFYQIILVLVSAAFHIHSYCRK